MTSGREPRTGRGVSDTTGPCWNVGRKGEDVVAPLVAQVRGAARDTMARRRRPAVSRVRNLGPGRRRLKGKQLS